MQKTFITKMPDHAGAFMEASRIIYAAGANISRVSYNKAVDMHTLFLDVSGTKRQLDVVSKGLEELGYIQNMEDQAQVLLLEFLLKDEPGTVLPVLELIDSYHFNISYISSHENETGYQNFKMGLFIEDPAAIRDFLGKASALCEIKVIDYDESERVLDNTVFYMGFANRMAQKLNLPRRKANELMTQSNRIMQMLDERNEPPYKTFDYISRWADMLAQFKGDHFRPQISRMQLSDCEMICIQPPCGSNTCIFHKNGELLFVDSGFAIYAPEMVTLLRRLFPNFDEMPRRMMITHPDMDHCGMLAMFDEIHLCYTAHLHFEMEVNGKPNFREHNPAHAPYCAISRILSRYIPPEMTHLYIVDQVEPDPDEPLGYIGSLEWQGKKFDFYRGNGGHVDGEVAIVCEEDHIVFTGDITVNIKGFSPEQAAFNRLAPYLMTSVNMDSARATMERKALEKRFPPEKYIYCCGHGAIWDRRIEKTNIIEEL